MGPTELTCTPLCGRAGLTYFCNMTAKKKDYAEHSKLPRLRATSAMQSVIERE